MFGEALGGILEENGLDVAYFDPKFKRTSRKKRQIFPYRSLEDIPYGLSPISLASVEIAKTNDLETALDDAEAMVLAVPSNAVKELLPRLPKAMPLIIATKGILSYATFEEFRDVMVMSGPGFAEDIAAGRDVLLAISDEWLGEVFAADNMYYEVWDDPAGLLICGALKNVYALRAGMLGMRPRTQEMRMYGEQVIWEMRQFLRVNGADESVAASPAGIGDLKISCTEGSRNFRFGQELARDPQARPKGTVEGIETLKRLLNREIIIPKEEIPIMKELLAIAKNWDF